MANLVGLIVKTLALLQLLLSGFFNVGGPDGRQTQVKYYPIYPYNNRQCSAIAAYQNIDLPLLSCTILLHMAIQM
jgi:hypothetical protein